MEHLAPASVIEAVRCEAPDEVLAPVRPLQHAIFPFNGIGAYMPPVVGHPVIENFAFGRTNDKDGLPVYLVSADICGRGKVVQRELLVTRHGGASKVIGVDGGKVPSDFFGQDVIGSRPLQARKSTHYRHCIPL